MNRSTIILTRSDVKQLLDQNECINAIEKVFKDLGEGKAHRPGILGLHAPEGGLHIKAGMQLGNKNYFVAKANANFPANPVKFSIPTIQGVVSVFDADNGRLLSLMDSIELTIVRTGAATAVATKFLSRENSTVATICGCGEQGFISFEMLLHVRNIEQVFLYDLDSQKAEGLRKILGHHHSVNIEVTNDLPTAVRKSDILITCTSASEPFIKKEFISPGTFIAAVGADNENKQEIDSDILSSVHVVTDLTSQAETIGELHHAIDHGLMTRENVYAELGDVIARKKPGRESDSEIILFDSTGMALQDVATASILYERAASINAGLKIEIGN